MLGNAMLFLIIAIIAGVLGFTGIAGAATTIAQILFFLFIVLFIISGLMALVLQWHHDGYRITPAQMARSTVTLLTTPLLSL